MDLGYARDRSHPPIPPDLAGPARRIATFLGGGGRAVVITGPPSSGKRALLDSLLSGMPGRVTRIENRTGAPMALSGVLQQMGKVAETEGDERGLFFRTLAEQAYDDYSAVIALEDAHTLTTLALSAGARVPGLGGPDLPGMILLLTGEASLLEKLEGPGLELLRNPRRTLVVALPDPAAPRQALPDEAHAGQAEPAPASAARVVPPTGQVGWSRGNLGMRAVVIALLAGAVAAAGGLTWSMVPMLSETTSAPVPSTPALPTPNALEPDRLAPSLPAAQPPADPAGTIAPAPPPTSTPNPPDPAPVPAPAPAPPAEAQLRREFDAFLNRAGRDTAKLTPAARETLFQEYQRWRSRGGAP